MSLAFSASAAKPVTRLASAAASARTGVIGVRTDLQFAMITSQTCDLSGKRGRKYPLLLAAPIYDAANALDRGQLGLIRRDRIGEFIALDGPRWSSDQELWVADLRFETSVEKGLLIDKNPIQAFAEENGYLRCSRKIARVRERVAVDDNIENGLLQPLRQCFSSGQIDDAELQDILIKATPSTTQARAVRLIVLVNRADLRADIQGRFDDWHAEIGPSIPKGLTFLGVEVREAGSFCWPDFRGAELVDL